MGLQMEKSALGCPGISVVKVEPSGPAVPAEVRYGLDSVKSNFIVRAFSGGLVWFKGHDHLIAIREFNGELNSCHQSSPSNLSSGLNRERSVSISQERSPRVLPSRTETIMYE